MNSGLFNKYKYVEITSYIYNPITNSFTEQYSESNTGNTKTVAATTFQPSGTTNMLVIGMISYSSGSQTGFQYAGAANVRKDTSVPFLTSSYYSYLQSFAS